MGAHLGSQNSEEEIPLVKFIFGQTVGEFKSSRLLPDSHMKFENQERSTVNVLHREKTKK